MSFSEKEHTFTRQEVIRLFDRCLRKPLINLDGSGVFKRLSGNTKVTGIAGDVIEQSVLGYPAFLPVFSRSPLILLQSIQERRSHASEARGSKAHLATQIKGLLGNHPREMVPAR